MSSTSKYDLEQLAAEVAAYLAQGPELSERPPTYATKLREADVPTASVRLNGTMLDFMMPAVPRDSEPTDAAMSLAASTFRRVFGTDHSWLGGE